MIWIHVITFLQGRGPAIANKKLHLIYPYQNGLKLLNVLH